MNDPKLFPSDRAADLSRLNEAEQRVLRLLGEGHTAKTIATELETTPAAVNERLREARRKTGVGSSRELARLLKAQENRDEQIGVAPLRHPVAVVPPSDAEPWHPQTGVFAMIALFVIAAAGAAALISPAAAPKSDIDPLIGSPLVNGPDLVALHAKVRSEPRDSHWALPLESSIRARLISLPLIGKDGNVLRVMCARTLCEISGTLLPPESQSEREDQHSQFNRTVNELQTPPLTDDLMHLGLKFEGATFTSGKGKPDRLVYLLYYSRAEAMPK